MKRDNYTSALLWVYIVFKEGNAGVPSRKFFGSCVYCDVVGNLYYNEDSMYIKSLRNIRMKNQFLVPCGKLTPVPRKYQIMLHAHIHTISFLPVLTFHGFIGVQSLKHAEPHHYDDFIHEFVKCTTHANKIAGYLLKMYSDQSSLSLFCYCTENFGSHKSCVSNVIFSWCNFIIQQ
jgi:hypothetical protein